VGIKRLKGEVDEASRFIMDGGYDLEERIYKIAEILNDLAEAIEYVYGAIPFVEDE